jgi:hypothetical protein
LDNGNDPNLLLKLSNHHDEQVREAVISGVLPDTLLDFKVWCCCPAFAQVFGGSVTLMT